jgi:hypothetical protein
VPGVSDSSPLIYLSSLRDLDLLGRIIGDIVIPHAVYREVVVDGHGQPGAEEVQRATGNWISVVDANDSSEVTRMMQVAGLMRANPKPLCSPNNFASGLFFSMTKMLFWKPYHVA